MVKSNVLSSRPGQNGQASIAKSDEGSSVSVGAAAFGMGWQLALVVLLPIFGGYKLDESMASAPVWTVVGLLVSMVGSILVIRRALAAFGNFTVPPTSASDGAAADTDAGKERPL